MKKLKILFACVENSFRSQIAEGVAKTYFSDRIEAFSAGSNPAAAVHPNAIIVLKEIGFDTSTLSPKGFLDLPNREFDYLVTMGCGETCPYVPSKAQIVWNLPDIKNSPIEEIREMRSTIKQNIENLLKEGNR